MPADSKAATCRAKDPDGGCLLPCIIFMLLAASIDNGCDRDRLDARLDRIDAALGITEPTEEAQDGR